MGYVLMSGGGNSADLDAITAAKGDVRAGKVIVNQDGEPVTGILTDRGAWSYTGLAGGATVKIPAGIHNGNGTVTAIAPDSLESQTPGTATSAKILDGETAWVKGKQLIGSMPNKKAWSNTGVKAGAVVTIPEGYHNGSGKIKTDSLESQTPGTATAPRILTGETAWVEGEQITGTMPDQTNKDSLGGINSNYPNVAIHKGTQPQFTQPTATGAERMFALRPDRGYWNGDTYVAVPVQSKSVTPTTAQQVISADSGKILEKVTVGAIPSQRGTSQKTVKCYSHTQSDGVTYLINWIPGGWYTAWQNDSSGNAAYAEIWTRQADVASAFGITAAKLKKGVTIAGITGTWEGYISDPVDLWKDGINNDGMTFDSNWGTSGTILWTAQNYAYVTTKKTYNLKKYSKLKVWTWYDSNRTTPESGNVSLLIAGSIPFVKDMYTVGQDFNKSSAAAWTEFDLSGLACNAQLKIRISCGINISHIRLE